jgi:hypothetical protein
LEGKLNKNDLENNRQPLLKPSGTLTPKISSIISTIMFNNALVLMTSIMIGISLGFGTIIIVKFANYLPASLSITHLWLLLTLLFLILTIVLMVLPLFLIYKRIARQRIIIHEDGIEFQDSNSQSIHKWNNVKSLNIHAVPDGEGGVHHFEIKVYSAQIGESPDLILFDPELKSTLAVYQLKGGSPLSDSYYIDPDKLVETPFGQYLLYYAPHIIRQLQQKKHSTLALLANDHEQKRNRFENHPKLTILIIYLLACLLTGGWIFWSDMLRQSQYNRDITTTAVFYRQTEVVQTTIAIDNNYATQTAILQTLTPTVRTTHRP